MQTNHAVLPLHMSALTNFAPERANEFASLSVQANHAGSPLHMSALTNCFLHLCVVMDFVPERADCVQF